MFTVTKATPLTPEKRIALAMIVLVIQDLKLEKEFLSLKEFYIINKNKKINKKNVFGAYSYLLSAREDPLFSYENCCNFLNLNSNNIRKIIMTKVAERKELTDLLVIWKKREEEKRLCEEAAEKKKAQSLNDK